MGKTIDPAIRAQIKFAYCVQRKTRAEIVKNFDVAYSTLSRWVKESNWDDLRGTRVMSGPFLAERFKRQMNQILDKAEKDGRELDNGETDRLVKLQKMVDSNDKNARFPAHVIEAMDLLNTYLSEREPELAQALTPHSIKFSEWVVKMSAHF